MEELDLKGMLDKFTDGGFQKGEQVILANFGTNQTLLSIIFQEPCSIMMLNQAEYHGVISRQVNLTCGKVTVCNAVTKIPKSKNRPEVIFDISAGTLGLGQILTKHKLPSSRRLKDVRRNKVSFWRTYEIEGPEVLLTIHEYFPRTPFENIGWIEKENTHD